MRAGDLEPGVHAGVSWDAYQAIPRMRATVVKAGARSMAHAYHAATVGREDSPALLVGRALHAAILEPDTYADAYPIPPEVDRRTKAGKAEWEEWVTAHPDAEILTPAQHREVADLARAVWSHPQAASLLRAPGRNEVTVIGELEGVPAKARLDRICKCDGGYTCVVDLKTTRDARPTAREFGAECARYGYHIQAAWYVDLLAAAAGDTYRRWLFIAVEKTAPNPVCVIELEAEAIEAGRQVYRRVLQQWRACKESGIWPGYGDGLEVLEFPEWALGEAAQMECEQVQEEMTHEQ